MAEEKSVARIRYKFANWEIEYEGDSETAFLIYTQLKSKKLPPWG